MRFCCWIDEWMILADGLGLIAFGSFHDCNLRTIIVFITFKSQRLSSICVLYFLLLCHAHNPSIWTVVIALLAFPCYYQPCQGFHCSSYYQESGGEVSIHTQNSMPEWRRHSFRGSTNKPKSNSVPRLLQYLPINISTSRNK